MFNEDKDSDNYETNKEAWEIITPYIPPNKKIWSPFYCKGKQKEIFKELGFDILHEDKDFFSYTPEYDLIICNPPFSKFKDISKKLKELDKPFIIICFPKVLLLKWFQQLFKEHLQVIIPFTRLNFSHYKTPKKGYTPPFGSWFFCYKMNLKKDLMFV